MELAIEPRLMDGEASSPEESYRLTLDGHPISDIVSHPEDYTVDIRGAAILLEFRSPGTAREKFEYYKAHPEKLPLGVTIRTGPKQE